MTKTVDEWSQQIRSALSTIDSQISTEIGDPIRKIIDAVASVAAGIDINSQVNNSFFDLDSKSGADLDALASWLGFGRRDGFPAVGTVRFYIDSPAELPIQIAAGTQVTDGSVVFATTAATVIAQFDTEVTARVQCTTVGIAGNVNAYTINQVMTKVANVDLHVENPDNMSNGVDIETDAELRKRIRQTFLRNVAGTEDAYRGVSDKVNGTRRVNVVGPIERWEEQLEVVELDGGLGGGHGFTSMIPCSKFTWPRQTYLVKEPGTPNEKTYREGIDYQVDTTHDPVHPTVKVLLSSDNLHLDDLSNDELDKIGEAIGLDKYAGEPATGSVTFGFDIAQKSNYVIKAGSRVQSPAGDIFTTDRDAVIYSGSFGSTAVPVTSQEMKAIKIPSGTKMTLMDRTGFKCMVSDAVSGGADPWDYTEYKKQIREEFDKQLSISPGDFLFFKHEYTPIDSRNDPAANPPLVNKVDVFIDGQDTAQIREVSLTSAVTLNEDPNDMFYVKNFYFEDGTQPVNGQKVEILGYNPVVNLPSSVNINGATYYEGEHYKLIKNQTLTRGSQRELAGLAWIPGKPIPADGSFVEMYYDYNRSVVVTDQLLDTNRQICTDVLCHEAKRVGLEINLVVQNVLGQSDESMYEQLNTAFDNWAKDCEFNSWIQWSDLEMIARSVIGVDACRIATPKDTWREVTIGPFTGQKLKSGIQTHETYRSFLEKQHDSDFRLWESMIPEIWQINICRTAANTYDEDYKG